MLKPLPPGEITVNPVDSHRAIAFRTRGYTQGPVTRLMSPADHGEILKPFVFLDLIDAKDLAHAGEQRMGLHPHSGIATLTWLFEGSVNYEDDLGRRGQIDHDWMEWMHAGSGAWHGGGFGKSDRLRGFQLWVALPASSELTQPYSRYVHPDSRSIEGPVTVLLGQYGQAKANIESPSPINYFSVKLKAGETWRYQPPLGHEVAWAAVSVGSLLTPGLIEAGEMATFEEGEDAIEFLAVRDTEFVMGSATKHPYELVLGHYSVHTSPQTLLHGETRIQEIANDLRQQGRLK
ncbi:pirin family protein [Dyella humicola]|uniref:pirin family protein n=1 Tax=Dyella humicola TaxID=2992126 RepID=UPI002252890C|nr:pirin family protein [Dyella humicola]